MERSHVLHLRPASLHVRVQLLSSEVADDSGWRLALAKIKVTVFTLLRHYSFEELPSKPAIFHIMKWVAQNRSSGCTVANGSVSSRPEVKGESGGQLPLLVRRFEA